ncbi:polysaccharide biosynthesis/export family protein [Ruegeria marina]|uniref:Exopolysaccharide production protein ExoF n=1 Tax=Ruegeria marina TaxID=639004 RepID=A0A1G6IBM3_9RHOB|nr:polysaccharide biosynthesis/export family protein [Ruegeria marina]SDC03881.1 exopolysaccharide production protein ExoF [Ruegeria marina]
MAGVRAVSVAFCGVLGAVSIALAATPDSYLINVGDELEMDILDDNDPPQRFTVGRDGAVQLPFIGTFEVAAIPVGEARVLIERSYVEREIFVNPSIELSIASFRPISVLGDVRRPGNFDYQPFMTTEQAVGLAGGPAISANNEEARILERRDLEGRLNGLEFDLALAAAQYARVQAQMAGKDAAEWNDVPPDLRADINRELFDEHKAKEDQVITLASQDVTTRRKLLTDAADEARTRIKLLEEREAVQKQVQEVTLRELDRVKEMAERGLVPKSSINENELRAKQVESQLLQLKEQRSAARVQLADLASQLSQFDSDREKNLLNDSQVYWSEINKLRSARVSLEDRMHLLEQWMNAARGLDTEMLLEYQVRRREDGRIKDVVVKPYDELLPGDLLVVVVRSPETLEAGQ